MGRHSRKRKRARARVAARILPDLSLPEALEVIAADSPDQLHLIAAAEVIADAAVQPESTISFDTLLKCIDHGGVAAEMAARPLNIILGRRTASEVAPSDIIVDRQYWIDYLDSVHRRETHGRMDRQADAKA